MSDPSATKRDREKGQVRAFLNGRGILFQSIEDGADPPDVKVLRDGLPAIDIEITDYHPEQDRVGVETRWAQLRETIDQLVGQKSRLKGVDIGPIFRDMRIPSRRRHQAIAEELVRCAEHFVNLGLPVERELKLSFSDSVPRTECRPVAGNWFLFPASEWPILSEQVSVLKLFRIEFGGFLPVNNPQAQGAFCSPYPEAFRELLEKKKECIVEATRQGRYLKMESPLWLLTGCNTNRDLRSEIFGSADLRYAVDESGFDFANSPFDEIWLMEGTGGRSQRLYPWPD